ncbi:TonB-dependent receptor [Novosphingobium sp. 1949]|uniref:TonB-dependent receptor n=1 Tax=Novosphingobium organovorum TaxID=2930092 RepID=A0ABT0BAT5_9SPHN|nr:TonB-dependent receptor [Novosphingobium organovorum]MCJ2182167.1 TonB-dependent receptor [Novosphingobium organovorum]
MTATHQAVTLNKVPVSIAAYDAKALDTRSIRTVTDLVRQTPGIDVAAGYASPLLQRISIRGIDSSAGAPTTAIYIDDAAIQAPVGGLNYAGSTVPQIFDLERVEVLRGPQGTLFGAGAEGGAVRFITPTPSLTQTSIYAKGAIGVVEGGGVGGEIGGAIGTPIITDTLGLRLSYSHRWDAGYVDRLGWDGATNDTNANSAQVDILRAALQYKPVDGVSLVPSVYYQRYAINDTGQIWQSLSDRHEGSYVNGFAEKQPARDAYVLPSLRTVVRTGQVEFTAITSFLHRSVTQDRDQTNIMGGTYLGAPYPELADGTVVSTVFHSHSVQNNFAQELRLASADNDAALHWQVGLYYSNVRQTSTGTLNSPYFDAALIETYGVSSELFYGAELIDGTKLYDGNEHTRERQLAAYASLDLKVTPTLTLTAAGRYGVDKIDYQITERDPSFGTTDPSYNNGAKKEMPFTPKFAVSWQRTPDQLVYASASKGFRAGGVNSTLPQECSADLAAIGYDSTPRTYDSDTTWSYEVGNKSRLLGGALSLDASAFYVKWNNIQQALRLGCYYSLVLNSGKAVSKGFDLNLSLRASKALSLGGSVGYTDAKYTQDVVNDAGVIALDGQTLGQSPWSLDLWVDYRFEAFTHPSYIRIQDSFKSRNNGLYGQQMAASPTYDANFAPDQAYNSFDVRLGTSVGIADLALVVQNAFNEQQYRSTISLSASPEILSTVQRPRYFGLEAIVRY